MKKVQIGARVSPEDVEFISSLKIEGANTPSDKLRAIIENARKNAQYSYDYAGSYRFIKGQLGPIVEHIKEIEHRQGSHSSVVERILEWMPDFYAFCLTSLNPEEQDNDLQSYERGAAERLFRLYESLLHLELSVQQTAYNPDLINSFVKSMISLLQVIADTNKKREE